MSKTAVRLIPVLALAVAALAAAPLPADTPARPPARTGIDVLASEGFARLKGRRVGTFDVELGRQSVWTFYLHLRDV